MSRFMSNPMVIDDNIDSICEASYMSIAMAVDGSSGIEITTEGFVDNVKEALKKICSTIMEWIRKLIQAFKDLKNWVVKHAKLLLARFKGEKKVEVVDSDKIEEAAKEIKEDVKKLASEAGKDSGKAVTPEVVDDEESKSAKAVKALNEPKAIKVLIIGGAQGPKQLEKELDKNTKALVDLQDSAKTLQSVADKKPIHGKDINKNSWDKEPGDPEHPRNKQAERARKLAGRISNAAKNASKNLNKLASAAGAKEDIETIDVEAS